MGRRKLVEDDALLAVAREAFVERGIAASTRDIARRAGISEAVIYQRHPTKADLFFAAMVPRALNVEDLFSAPANDLSTPTPPSAGCTWGSSSISSPNEHVGGSLPSTWGPRP
jgi:AcrR family transcriptional regulator